MRWDLFCRVIDNYGDIGVAWRLAADLAARGESVRLWADDASALTWMAPAGAAGVEIVAWGAETPEAVPGDVVIELFGCDPPPDFVARMTAQQVWINLEYLSAQPYVERSHGLPSPQHGGAINKWFFYPGFTPRTGGLLREPGLLGERAQFDRAAWLAQHAIALRAGEQLMSSFAYPQAPLEELLSRLCTRSPVRLLLTPGMAAPPSRAGLSVQRLPWLAQPDFDRLLWACDFNLVRGEDSMVRALWAGVPLLWHIYPQHDGAHAHKLDAWLDRVGAGAGVAAVARAWNGLGPWPAALPPLQGWRAEVCGARDALATQPDLVTQLLGFVAAKR